MKFNKISVVGLGYIGLPTAAVIASRGVSVVGLDIRQSVVDTINNGNVHIVEPDLDMLVHAAVKAGDLKATIKPQPADAFIIAVPTPFKGDQHEPDLSYIESAINTIAPVLEKGNLVILESTSPVGATEKVAKWIAQARPNLKVAGNTEDEPDIYVAHCPERVLPGRVIHELVENDRVIGGITKKCAEYAKELYKIFVTAECVITDSRTAELAKLTENAFRDVNIAFANELSLIADRHDVDVWELIGLANRHPRVNILKPGPGVGGHCIAVDPWFLVNSAPEQARLIHTARQVNDSKPDWVISKVDLAKKEKPDAKIACLGLAFKPDIDDLRESPALAISEKLAEKYPGQVLVVEPNVDKLPRGLSGSVKLVDAEQAIKEAAILLGLVAHKEFNNVSMKELPGKLYIDACGMWNAS